MQLDIRARKVKLPSATREFIERRLGFALGRFGHRVSKVMVLLEHLNAPKDGMGVRCRIEGGIVPRGMVMAETTDVDVNSAVSRAVDRMARRVRDAIDRRRTKSRWGHSPAISDMT
ncbi:MAG: HPF/RaiA family ribosome-associated protein [Phycisphaerales bacterium]|nr:MAG: HPF/RaiA family ribosome-associated protein [Phycisphaerales bacterium]